LIPDPRKRSRYPTRKGGKQNIDFSLFCFYLTDPKLTL